MNGVLVVDGAVNVLKTGAGLVADSNAASKTAAAEAQSVNAVRLENNATRDMAGYGTSAERAFQPGTTTTAERINAGQVTDRDGLPRIDSANVANTTQVKENIGQPPERWATQRPAWQEGTTVIDRVTTQPETYSMAIDKRQYQAILDAGDDQVAAAKALGSWATKDAITSLADVRTNLAVPVEWKSGELYTVEFKVKPGVGLREGTVGPMWSTTEGVKLPGGGNQVNFMQNSPYTNPDLYLIDINSLKLLK